MMGRNCVNFAFWDRCFIRKQTDVKYCFISTDNLHGHVVGATGKEAENSSHTCGSTTAARWGQQLAKEVKPEWGANVEHHFECVRHKVWHQLMLIWRRLVDTMPEEWDMECGQQACPPSPPPPMDLSCTIVALFCRAVPVHRPPTGWGVAGKGVYLTLPSQGL